MIMMIALSPGLHVGDYVPVLVKKKNLKPKYRQKWAHKRTKWMDGGPCKETDEACTWLVKLKRGAIIISLIYLFWFERYGKN
jgi:hypothetical protein